MENEDCQIPQTRHRRTGSANVSSATETSAEVFNGGQIPGGKMNDVFLRNAFPMVNDEKSHDPYYARKSVKNINNNYENGAEKVAKVLVIYTGGTIGMIKNEAGVLVPQANILEKKLREFPQLHDKAYSEEIYTTENGEHPLQSLVLPNVGERCRVIYTILEYSPLLDSSNITIKDWMVMALDIKEAYDKFDGFVILHGTDTMAYTASALSFMLECLGKSVVITGSQIPLFEPRTDGRDNLLNSLILAGCYCIPEVTILFNNKLLRGNRTSKISAGNLNAFDSPNLPPLATIGINIDVNHEAIYRSPNIAKCHVHDSLNGNVVLFRIFPSITVEVVKAFLNASIEGVVLQTYGAGNAPTHRKDILDELKKATARGVIIVNCTQCNSGGVVSSYATGKALLDAGVISGVDMTPEAALTKLSYVLSKQDWSLEKKIEMMENNLRGEITINQDLKKGDIELIRAVAKQLNFTSSQEVLSLKRALYPSILCTVASCGDLRKLNSLNQYGAYLSACNYDYRTPLHIAACHGHEDIVEFLLENGASVHASDREHKTPLVNAIECDQHTIIQLLRKAGAYLNMPNYVIGEMLCCAAKRNDVRRLISFSLADADLNTADKTARTALHVATELNHLDTVQYLLSKGVNLGKKDLYGHTAKDIADILGHTLLFSILNVSENGKVDEKQDDL